MANPAPPKPTLITRGLYQRYLNSSAWQMKRIQRMTVDGGKCQGCERRDDLHVHHMTYARFGDEDLADLITVCEECHRLIHQVQRRTRRPLTAVSAEVLELIAMSPGLPRTFQPPDHVPRHIRIPGEWRAETRNGGTWAHGARQRDEVAAARRANGL